MLIWIASANRKLFDPVLSDCARAIRQHQPSWSKAVELRKNHIVGEREIFGDAFALPIFAEQPYTLRQTSNRRSGANRCADFQCAAVQAIEPENCAQELGSPRTNQPGEPQHFTAPELEARRNRKFCSRELAARHH